jgi:UDP-N-acetylglucosamine--N-acetylmuramyl-(pentapeptide) pyrophosphoryl-undecaprenol N-acetylglucosamine transferase
LAGRDVESGSTAGWDGPVISVRAVGFPAGFSFRAVAVAWRLGMAVVRCWARMRSNVPDVLLAMGSYASVGPVLAARTLGVPVVLHEANAVPGRAIAFLSRFARAVAVGFKEAGPFLRNPRVVVTGFPVRTDLESHFGDDVLRPGMFTVLVMGGSQGAHRLNEIVPQALIRLNEERIPLQVIHLAGAKDAEMVRSVYEKAGVPTLVFDFLKEMGKAYHAASVAIARAGAATCAELSACGVPALFVPLPHVSHDHQTANARAMAATGGADMVDEKEFSVKWVAEYVEGLYRDPEKLDRMKKQIKSAVMPGAAEKIADLVESVVRGRGSDWRKTVCTT